MRLAFILFGFFLISIACTGSEGDFVKTPIQSDLTYDQTKAKIVTDRQALVLQFNSGTATEKEAALQAAGKRLRTAIIDDIIPYWYGTPWDFNGITRTPGTGQIACGYFVTTVLQDAGIILERAGLAQLASSEIIKALCVGHTYDWISGKTREQFLEGMKAKPEGIYIVGLDNHIGFLQHTAAADWFIHASYLDPVCVVKEKAGASKVLAASKVFVVGQFSPSRALVESWLKQTKME
jgi:hypothetical protein